MEIVRIEPRWNLQWANTPDINVFVDKYERLNYIWRPIPQDARDHVMLISTNQEPWIKFVYIEKPDGRPNLHGALGGDYELTDGDTLKSRTGWSSRAGIINRDYRDFLEDEIVEVTVYEPESRVGMAGFSLYVNYLLEHPAFPREYHLVREIKFKGNEPYWTFSVDPLEVRKPNEEK